MIPLLPADLGLAAKVDDDVFDEIGHIKWHVVAAPVRKEGRNRPYAGRRVTIDGRLRLIYMHRVIMGARDEEIVDHKNGDRFDNQRGNLRLVTDQQNRWNSTKRRGTSSRFKGVSLDRPSGKWAAQIWVNKRNVKLGLFADEAEAAMAYDRGAKEHFGDFARLNFPAVSAVEV